MDNLLPPFPASMMPSLAVITNNIINYRLYRYCSSFKTIISWPYPVIYVNQIKLWTVPNIWVDFMYLFT